MLSSYANLPFVCVSARGMSLNQEGRTRMESFQETGYKVEQIQGSPQEREREEQRPIKTELEGLRVREEEEEHQWHIQTGVRVEAHVNTQTYPRANTGRRVHRPT